MKTTISFAALALGSTLFATAAMAASAMAPTGAPTNGGMMATHKPGHHKQTPAAGAMGGAMAPHTNAMAPAGNTMTPANTMGGSH